MKKLKHFLSDPAEWITKSEFVDRFGNITTAIGESKIETDGSEITNEVWTCIDGKRVRRYYTISVINDSFFTYKADNEQIGNETGVFSVLRNMLFSHFIVPDTKLSGFEVFLSDEDECSSYGSLFEGSELIHSWRTILVKI